MASNTIMLFCHSIVTCEKAGYITQKKRFNILQAIDQKEISTKFNLVKE